MPPEALREFRVLPEVVVDPLREIAQKPARELVPVMAVALLGTGRKKQSELIATSSVLESHDLLNGLKMSGD